MLERKLWNVRKRDWPSTKRLVSDLGISSVAAHLLVNRGIYDGEEAQAFFAATPGQLSALEAMPGCAEAAAVIADVVAQGKKIAVFGDYDADGVTATAILVKGLEKIGAHVDYRIPDRFSEGYDLNKGFVESAGDKGYDLIITVDCGIKAFESIELARKKGVKVIITDHHQPGDTVPEADVVINPKLHEDTFTKELAGAGVALAVVRAFWCHQGINPEEEDTFRELLELAAIGTIADSVSLLGCNRVIVKNGLQRLGETENIGLSALFEVENLKNKKAFEVKEISFRIAPCINAVGRIGDANDAVALLVSDAAQEAWDLAKKLHRCNALRQNMDGTTYLEAVEKVEQEIDLDTDKVIVLASENWHPGVIGISAAKVVQRYNLPAVLISVEDGVGKGSARSPRGFDIHSAFTYCRSLLLKFGGHKMAGGFSICAENIPGFRSLINEYAQDNCTELGECLEEADDEIFLQDLDFNVMEEIESMEPFGSGNPEPRLIISNVQVSSIRFVGKKNEHVQLVVTNGETKVDCIGFRMSEELSQLKHGDWVDLLFTPQINRWNGSEKIQLVLSDVRWHQELTAALLYSKPSEMGIKEIAAAVETTEVEKASLETTGVDGASETGNGAGCREILDALKEQKQVQYFAEDAEEKLLNMLPFLKKNRITPVVLFPLQSMAVDFQRRLSNIAPDLKASLIDCITPDAEICLKGKDLAAGKIDALVTSFGTWQANGHVLQICDPQQQGQSCLCICMGHWGTMFPDIGLLEDVHEIVAKWNRGALLAGSGKHLKTVLNLNTVTDLSIGDTSLTDPEISLCQNDDKLDMVCRICSQGDKNLVFVNSSKDAIALSRELSKVCFTDSGEIRSYYGGLDARQKRLTLEYFNRGTSKILVSSRSLDTSNIVTPDSLVVYRFPINSHDFNRFLIAPKVYLTYNQKDFEKSRAYSQSLYPDDSILEYVGKNLRTVGNDSFSELHRKFSKGLQGNNRYSHRALSVALTIFIESPQDYSQGEMVTIARNSWRYQEARKEMESFNYIAQELGNL